MKYLYYVAAIILAVSLLVGYKLFKSAPTPEDGVAIIVNDKSIMFPEFNKKFISLPYHVQDPYASQGKSDFIQSLITKELLIQESQRLGIDREEQFRKSVQNFYEQALIKTLMDRKFSSLTSKADDKEVKRYLELLDRTIHLYIFTFPTLKDAENKTKSKKETQIALFQDLSGNIKNMLLSLDEGETSKPTPAGDQYIVLRVDKIDKKRTENLSDIDRETAKNIIQNHKREQAINNWIAELREKASIQIFVDNNNGEDK